MSAIRCDSYQTGGSVTAVIYIKGHTIADIRPRGTTNQLVVDATVDGKPFTHTWYWAGETNPSSPKVDQGSVKVEITVPKMTKTMWQKAEDRPDEEKPVSLYEKWGSKQIPKEEEEKPVGLEATLRSWYRDADEDSRRAMIKSMQESGGTVFNPNWKEVGAKKIEPFKSREDREKQEKEDKERADREKKAIEDAKRRESPDYKPPEKKEAPRPAPTVKKEEPRPAPRPAEKPAEPPRREQPRPAERPKSNQRVVELGKGCQYNRDMPFDGIMSYFACEHGGNPHEVGVVSVCASSVNAQGQEPQNIFDYKTDKYYASVDTPDSWINIDFGKRRIAVTGYSIKSYREGGSSARHFMRNWVLLGSNNGSTWTTLDSRDNDSELNGISRVQHYEVQIAEPETLSFRYIRLAQTGRNHRTDAPHYVLSLAALELFGFINDE